MTQPYSPELHNQIGTILGVPVFEDGQVDAPTIIRVPIPNASDTRVKLIVRDWRQFEREWWIETTLNKVVTEQMGDTLEWLYGERRWRSPNSPYSMLMMRLRLQLQMEATRAAVQLAAKSFADYARTIQSVFAPVAGLFDTTASTPDSGSTPTESARDLNT